MFKKIMEMLLGKRKMPKDPYGYGEIHNLHSKNKGPWLHLRNAYVAPDINSAIDLAADVSEACSDFPGPDDGDCGGSDDSGSDGCGGGE